MNHTWKPPQQHSRTRRALGSDGESGKRASDAQAGEADPALHRSLEKQGELGTFPVWYECLGDQSLVPKLTS